MSLYQRIGEEKIILAVTAFYKRAFEDPIIGHFFFEKDRESLTSKQIDFAVNMLGGPKRYAGRPLEAVHEEFSIRRSHFDRRQVILKEVLAESGLARHEVEEWLVVESNLRSLIVTVKDAVNKASSIEAQ